jgi:CCR4-NOT transcriptional regulation complex NOT5 subunit
MDANPPKLKPEPLFMSPDTVVYFRECLAEIKADLKDIKKQQHEHDKEIERQKWRHGFFGIVGGAISSFGMKFTGLFP